MSPTAVLNLHTQGYVPYGGVIPTYIVMPHIAVLNLHIKSYSPYCSIILAHTEEILYNTYQEMAIWKSIVTLIYRELLALGRKIDILKLIYRYLLAFGR
jgi:hypothetical protein